MRRRRRSRTVFETRSALSGRIRVIDYRRERRLVVAGSILSALPLDGNWTTLRHEYWWRALSDLALPARSTALFVGLGGGTQLHLLARVTVPRCLTIIERDPEIVRIAVRWFGLDAVGPLEFLCEEAAVAVPALTRARRRFDFVMEDAAYGDEPERSLPLARALVPLVAAGGRLVINRHRRGDAERLAEVLAPAFAEVRVRRVRRRAENVLVCCAQPLRRRSRPDSV
jgi:hypothetical protein